MKHVFFLSQPVNCTAWEGSQPSTTCENFHLMFSQEHQSYIYIQASKYCFQNSLKLQKMLKKKKPCLINEVVSLLLIIQTPSGTCLKHSGGLFNRASSSIPYPQVQLWTTVPFSGTAEERAPWRHELHRYSSHTIIRQERPTVRHKYWRYESNVPPVSRLKPLNLYTFCVNFISW